MFAFLHLRINQLIYDIFVLFMNLNPPGPLENNAATMAVWSLQPFQIHSKVSLKNNCFHINSSECLADDHSKQLNNLSLGPFLGFPKPQTNRHTHQKLLPINNCTLSAHCLFMGRISLFSVIFHTLYF